jgi:hypothetical protein
MPNTSGYLEVLLDLLLFPDGDESRVIIGAMKVWGYFDASGHHDNLDGQGRPSPAVTVAGYLATPLQWKQFDKDWKKRLDEAGLPYFHMTDFVSQQKLFKNRNDWPKEKRDRLITDLIQIISNNVIYGVGMAIVRADYNKVIEALPIVRKFFGSPYTFCSIRCFETGVDWARAAKYDETIKYIFESGDEHQHEVLAAHTSICKDDKRREFYRFGVGSLTFEDGARVRPLQAADILAHELYKEMGRQVYPNKQYPYTRESMAVLHSISGTYKHYNEEDLMGYLEDAVKVIEERKKAANSLPKN